MSSYAFTHPLPYLPGNKQKVGPKSKTIFHEILLKEAFEKYPNSPNKARADACFSTLDDITPYLGTFAPVVKMIKEELYRSVFSRGLTSGHSKPYIERLPYFNSFKKLDEARKAEELKTKTVIYDYEEKLRFRDNDLRLVYKRNIHLKRELELANKEIDKKNEKISELFKMVKENDDEKEKMRKRFMDTIDSLERKNESLSITLDQAHAFIEKTTSAKSDEAIDAIAASKKGFGITQETEMTELVLNSQGVLEHDYIQCDRLEQQLSEIFNILMDDYDLALDQLRKKRSLMDEAEKNKSVGLYSAQVEDLQNSFMTNVDRLLKENDMVSKHSQGLYIVANAHSCFNPQEFVARKAEEGYRKFAGILEVQTSADPSNFKLLEGAPFCVKCGANLAFCPHINNDGHIIPLPANTTHVRLVKPSLKLRVSKFVKNIDPPKTAHDTEIDREHYQTSTPYTFQVIFEDYYENRGGFKPRVMRDIPLNKLVSLVHEIFTAKWNQEQQIELEDSGEEVSLIPFTEFFYAFLRHRYRLMPATLRAAYNIIRELTFAADFNNVSWLFTRHLSGEDDVRWKYFYLIQDLLSTFGRMDLNHYRGILQIVYALRPKEVADHVELEMTSFSKNKFTSELIEDHFLYMMRTNTDPNYPFFYAALKKFDIRKREMLSCQDFIDAIDYILPGLHVNLIRRHYELAEFYCDPGAVPLSRLANTSAFLMLYKNYKNSWDVNGNPPFSPEFKEAYQMELERQNAIQNAEEASPVENGKDNNALGMAAVDNIQLQIDVQLKEMNRTVEAELEAIRRAAGYEGEESDSDDDEPAYGDGDGSDGIKTGKKGGFLSASSSAQSSS